MKSRFYNVKVLHPNGNQVGMGLIEYPTLKDMQQWVGGGLIERVPLPRDMKDEGVWEIIVNEEGLLKDMAYNEEGSRLADQDLVGPVVIFENFNLK